MSQNRKECQQTFIRTKYHINTVAVIKLSVVKTFIPVANFLGQFCYLRKESPFRSNCLFNSGVYSKKPAAKFWGFTWRKKGREKTILLSSNMGTINVVKREARVSFSISKSFNVKISKINQHSTLLYGFLRNLSKSVILQCQFV